MKINLNIETCCNNHNGDCDFDELHLPSIKTLILTHLFVLWVPVITFIVAIALIEK